MRMKSVVIIQILVSFILTLPASAGEQKSFQEAELLYRLTRFSEAKTAFQEFLNSYNNSVLKRGIFYYLGSISKEFDKDYDKAMDYYGRVLALKTNASADLTVLALRDRGEIKRWRKKDYDGAIDDLEAILKIKDVSYPTDEIYYSLAFTYLKKNGGTKAAEYFSKLSSEFPTSILAPRALYEEGLIYYKLKRYIKAVGIFNKLITTYPRSEWKKAAMSIRKKALLK